jgi:hypothetical protein
MCSISHNETVYDIDSDYEEKNDQFKNKDNIEEGNDYTIDKHGNIIYGKNYIGALLLPKQSLGLTVDKFIENYLNIEKNIRLEFISNENRNYIPNYYINCIINTLDEYEKNKDLSYLQSNLDNMISRYFKEEHYKSSYNKLQLKHLLEIYRKLVDLKESKIPSMEEFLNSKITRKSILKYKSIYEDYIEEKNIKTILDYIQQNIFHQVLTKPDIKKIQIFIKDFVLIKNLQIDVIKSEKMINKVIEKLKEKFIDFEICLDPMKTYIYIDWS